VRDWKERFLDMREASENIMRYASKGREAFDRDELIQNWFVRQLQILGEAARAVPEDVRIRYPEIPWRKIIGMRSILVHTYFRIDPDIVWNVVVEDIPSLLAAIDRIIDIEKTDRRP